MTAQQTVEVSEAAPAYPTLPAGMQLHRNAEGGFVLIPRVKQRGQTFGRQGAEFAFEDPYRLEGYLIDYLSNVDGQRDRDDLRKKLVESYDVIFGPMLADRAWNWLLGQSELVAFLDEPSATSRAPELTGSASAFYPMHCTFEIIETCNFSCDHCYYSSSPFKKGRMEVSDARKVMDTLAANGAKIIELTGGECTIHPGFLEILDYASRKFELVAIITNGYRIGTNEEFARKVGSTPNLIAQVSIDAIRERHDRFRKHVHAFDAAVEAVRRLVAAGRLVRISSSITEDTVDDIAELHRLGVSLGVAKHSYAPVAPLGRGCNVTEAGAASQNLVDRIEKALRSALAPDRYDPSYAEMPDAAEVYEAPRNCGAGWRSFAVDYDGWVRACNFSRDSKRFGNILADDYHSLFGQQANFYFQNAPSPGGRDCQGCAYNAHCRGCFVKAFMVSETEFPQCPWRRRWFPNMSLTAESDPLESHAPLATKRGKVPRFTAEDSVHTCDSCMPAPPAAPPHPGSSSPVPSTDSRPVFLGKIGHGVPN